MGMAEPLNVARTPLGELSPVARFLDSNGGGFVGGLVEAWRHELAGPMVRMTVFGTLIAESAGSLATLRPSNGLVILSSNALVTFSSFIIQ